MSKFKPLPMVPHTAAKHQLLRKYLDCWFPILGTRFSRINYVDGFAGPGVYEGGALGSPMIAIESAKTHVEKGNLRSDVVINFVFVESDPVYAGNLRCLLSEQEFPPNFNIKIIEGKFSDQFSSILTRLGNESRSHSPTFAFVDPFGFSGIPFSLLEQILKSHSSEVFINVMVNFINRFLEHPSDSVVRHFPETFGTEEVLDIPNRSGDRVQQILNLYRSQLKKHARFVGQFDMHGKQDRNTYSLFFASNVSLGFKKMKEVMWSVDKVSGSRFSDTDSQGSQNYLFQTMGIESLWDAMLAEFANRQVPMTRVEKVVNEETVFVRKHAKQLLELHEQAGDICVIPIKVEILFSPGSP